jgi:hypothetical protein
MTLDEQIAVEVMGYVFSDLPLTDEDKPTPRPLWIGPPKHYSTSIADAWMVVEKFKTFELFSKRLVFTMALQEIVSERIGIRDGLLIHFSEVLLHITPEDICRAASPL